MRVRQEGLVLINIRPVLLVNTGLGCHCLKCLMVSQGGEMSLLISHHYRGILRYTLGHHLGLKMPANENSIKVTFQF